MSQELEALFCIDGSKSKPKVKFSADCSLEELIHLVEGKFKDFLDKNQLCITLLQLYDKDYNEYVNIEESELKNIPNRSKIKVVTGPRESVSQDHLDDLQVQLSPEPVSSVIEEPPEDGCETCFSFEDDHKYSPATPQDTNGEQAAATFPKNRLWNKSMLRVYFLNPIPSSWTYSGHKYKIPNAQPGHIIDKSDILRLANNWSIHLPSVSKEQHDCVPSFVEAMSPENSDIRVWLRTTGGCLTNIGSTAENIPRGDKEANATMFLNLSGQDGYKEHLVMHEFGHALGLGHEHQQGVFRKNIDKFFYTKCLKKHFGGQYSTDVNVHQTPSEYDSEYDPNSIMHYWFSPSWLKPEYNTEDKVDRHTGITEEEKKVLKALHRRKNMGLAEEISVTDYKSVAKAYYNHRHRSENTHTESATSNVPAGGAPNPKPQSSSLSFEPGSPLPDQTDGIVLNSIDESNRYIYFNSLFDAVYKVGQNKWRNIGSALDMDPDTLTSIADNFRKSEDCLREMLRKWFQVNEKCYLSTFLKALKASSVELIDLAPHVKKVIISRRAEYEAAQQTSGPVEPKPQPPSSPQTRHIKLNGYNSKYFNVLYEASFKEARNKWREIGNALKLHNGDLVSIYDIHHGNPGRCYNAMLAKWFESSTNCYFDVFTKALRADPVDLESAIEYIEEIIYDYADSQGRKRKSGGGNESNRAKRSRAN